MWMAAGLYLSEAEIWKSAMVEKTPMGMDENNS